MKSFLPLVVAVVAAAPAALHAGPVDAATLRVANWLVGDFDNHAQIAADRAAGSGFIHEEARLLVRPLQDPVVFLDGLYVYVENRRAAEAKPYRQRIFRLRKSGRGIRLEPFRIDARVLSSLSQEPQMLNSLAPSDLTKVEGCDVLLAERPGEYQGSTSGRGCPSEVEGSAYMTSALRVTKDMVIILDRGYDEKGVQTFGPAEGQGYEFRRIVP